MEGLWYCCQWFSKISAINIVATEFSTTLPYAYRLLGLQYDSCDSYFSNYGNPILSLAQNTDVCSYGSLGGNGFCIILTPQTIIQIQISVDHDIVNKGSGQLANINFNIMLKEIQLINHTIWICILTVMK